MPRQCIASREREMMRRVMFAEGEEASESQRADAINRLHGAAVFRGDGKHGAIGQRLDARNQSRFAAQHGGVRGEHAFNRRGSTWRATYGESCAGTHFGGEYVGVHDDFIHIDEMLS